MAVSHSTLHTFLHRHKNLILHFLNGHNAITELESLNPHLTLIGRTFLAKTTLSVLHLLSLLKDEDSFGLYLDSETPFFTYKLEASADGRFRTLLLPEDFSEFPSDLKLTGKARFIKKVKQEKAPYMSVVPLETTHIDQVVNELLRLSFQVQSKIFISPKLETSLMVSTIPPQSGSKALTLEEFQESCQQELEQFVSNLAHDDHHFLERVNQDEWRQIGERKIAFFCSCTRQNMLDILVPIYQKDPSLLFTEEELLSGKPFELKCDYCKKPYTFYPSDFV